MKKWIKRFLYVLLALLIVFGIVGFIFFKRFVVSPPEAEFPAPENIEEAQTQDLEYLALYPDLDRSLDTEQKSNQFQKGIRELKDKLPVSAPAFEMEIARLVAQVDNTHTNVAPNSRAKRLNAIPLRFHWFADGLRVLLAREEHADLLGARILQINGYQPELLLTQLKPWFGGANSSFKDSSPFFFMSPEVLYAVGFGENPDEIAITYLLEDTTSIKIAASDLEKDIPGYWPSYWLNKDLKDSNWKSVTETGQIAIPFQELEQNVIHQFFGETLYVQVNENFNSEKRDIKQYLSKVIQEAEDKSLKGIVLDVRFNPGGNYHLVWPFIKSAKHLLSTDQPFYIITGNGTFSAGVITVAYAKKVFGKQAIIIGEPMGDRLQFWADGGVPMILPNSKIRLNIWTAYHDWKNGCKDWSKCFWITIFDGVAAGEVALDKTIVLDFKDYLNGKDTALEYILSNNEPLNSSPK